MLLRVQKYDLSVKYLSGKFLHVADTLSRAHSADTSQPSQDDDIIHQFIQYLPISHSKTEELRQATISDKVLQQLAQILKAGWPTNIVNVPQDVRDYWNIRHEVHIAENLLFIGDRLIVPVSKRKDILKLIHEGHFGIEKCKARARSCVYWPRINEDIENEVKSCSSMETATKKSQ